MSHALTKTINGEQTVTLFDDETSGRAAWLAATRDVRCDYAALAVTSGSGAFRLRTRCQWSTRGDFLDRSEAHRDELAALCSGLTATAPAGYSVTVGEVDDTDAVVLEGREKRRVMAVAYSTAERVQTEWRDYVSAPEAA